MQEWMKKAGAWCPAFSSTKQSVSLRRQRQLFHQRLRQGDGREQTGGEEIVFARFVHDAEHFLAFGFFVGQQLVNLARFEGGFVTVTAEANHEFFLSAYSASMSFSISPRTVPRSGGDEATTSSSFICLWCGAVGKWRKCGVLS